MFALSMKLDLEKLKGSTKEEEASQEDDEAAGTTSGAKPASKTRNGARAPKAGAKRSRAGT